MHTEAAQVLADRAQLSPHNPMIWNDLGVELMAAGQPDAACRAFLRAHKSFPEYPLPLYNLGRLSMNRVAEHPQQASSPELVRKLAAEAIDYLNQSLSKDPLLRQAHALLSIAYSLVGDKAQANFHAQKASRFGLDRDENRRRTWLQRIPILRKATSQTALPSLPFLSSSSQRMHKGVH